MIKRALLIVLAFFLFSPAFVFAQNDSRKIITLPQGEIFDGDYFAAGEIVEISGTVNGDVYAAGGQIIVDGIVNGDLLAGAGTITVSGSVSGNIRAIGGQILLTGNVGRNAALVAGNVELANTSRVAGNVNLAAGSTIINAEVGGDVNGAVGNLRLGADAAVAGDINYASDTELSQSNSANVSGTINKTQTPEFKPPSKDAIAGFFAGLDLFAKFASFIASLVVGLLMIRFLPTYTKNAANIVSKRFLPSLSIGFLGLVAVPVLIALLFATLLGIPLALLAITAFVLYLYIVRIFAMVAIGEFVASRANIKTANYWVFAIGLAVYYILTLIPIVGWIVKIIILIASFGAALQNEQATWRKAIKAKVV